MSFEEYKLVDIYLPSFLENFKTSCLGYIIPPLNNMIDLIKQQEVTQKQSPIILLILLVVAVQIIWNFSHGIFSKQLTTAKSEPQDMQTKRLAKDLKDLQKQLKKVQSKFKEYQAIKQQSNGALPKQSISSTSKYEEAINQMISLYKASCDRNQNLNGFVLESQLGIVNELKKIKKSTKTRRQSSHLKNSTMSLHDRQPSTSSLSSSFIARKIDDVKQYQKPQKKEIITSPDRSKAHQVIGVSQIHSEKVESKYSEKQNQFSRTPQEKSQKSTNIFTETNQQQKIEQRIQVETKQQAQTNQQSSKDEEELTRNQLPPQFKKPTHPSTRSGSVKKEGARRNPPPPPPRR